MSSSTTVCSGLASGWLMAAGNGTGHQCIGSGLRFRWLMAAGNGTGHQCIGSGRHKLAEHQCTGQRLAQAGRVTVHKAAAGTSWQSFPNRHDVAHHGGKKRKMVCWFVGWWLVGGR